MAAMSAARRWLATTAVGVGLSTSVVACTPPIEIGPRTVPVTTTTVAVGYPATPVGDDQIHLNQIQLVGTHNSYHIAPAPQILDLISSAAAAVPAISAGLGNPASLNYTHASIPQQLARGIRTFEFDIWADPTGNRFANPALAANLGFTDPLRPTGLEVPGFKVFHIVDVDWRTECVSLQVCLGEIRTWSNAHPGHLPIVINVELKDGALPAPLSGTPVLPFDGPTLDAVDAELNTAIGDRIITPDTVRGAAADLNTAITTTGWPTLAASRGKVLFFMDNESLRTAYLTGHPSLVGRTMFTSSGEGQPDGAILKVNDPTNGVLISQLVAQGYIVRTRADADSVEAWTNNTSRRDIALASGAQIVHTDYPVGEPYSNGYQVNLGLPAQGRCNPVTTAPASCVQSAVVEPH